MGTGDQLDALARHAAAKATLRPNGERSGAAQVLVLLDSGEDRAPTMIEWRPGIPLELTDGGITWEVPDAMAAATAPLALPDVVAAVPASAIEVDLDGGTVQAPPGTVPALCRAVTTLAEAFGGRSVASADWITREPGPLLTVAARPGEPAVIGVGDQLFEIAAEPA